MHLEYELLLHISIPHRYKSVYDELKNVTCQEDNISRIPRRVLQGSKSHVSRSRLPPMANPTRSTQRVVPFAFLL